MTFADAGGGDFIKLSSTTPSSAGSISLDGFFTSDYDVYKIFAENVRFRIRKHKIFTKNKYKWYRKHQVIILRLMFYNI